MNNDELKGKLENLKGRAKEAYGSVSGDKKAQAGGLAERVEGAAIPAGAPIERRFAPAQRPEHRFLQPLPEGELILPAVEKVVGLSRIAKEIMLWHNAGQAALAD